MRKLVLTTLLLVSVGAVTAAWLSSSTPSGSSLGDVSLADDRIPGRGLRGLRVPPREERTNPARPFLTARRTPGAGALESLPVPDTTIASRSQASAPRAARRSFTSRNSDSLGARTNRQARSSSSGGRFAGIGGVGVGGGVGGGRAVRTTRDARDTTTVRPERTPRPVADPRPPASAPPSRVGGGGSGGGGSSSSPPTAAPTATVTAALPPAAAAPVVSAIPPVSPGLSPSASPTPEPTTMLLLGTGIAGLYRMRRYLE